MDRRNVRNDTKQRFSKERLKFLTKMLWINDRSRGADYGRRFRRRRNEMLQNDTGVFKILGPQFLFVLNRKLEIRLLISKLILVLRKALS